ncbi:T9SS type A sorting domain-containing protein [Flavobacterium fluviatile]|uniref:T9SS type A sorting domain-containing protein n=1 Tax=Flavobacterium fluviatile TaxID=1862387 RepID=UPI0013D8BC08|nr:T9SS type A sorting domain-containing protein [Flavobacterium fluviatile]
MRKILTFLMFVTFFLSAAQDKLTFSYDPLTGNQIVRALCLNCQTQKPAKDAANEAITNEDLLQFSSEDVISYYPNPVKEELYLKWELTNDNSVSSIQITGITGQVLATYRNTATVDSFNIPFQSYSGGVYIVSLTYRNGAPKTIKIIKK